MSDVNNEDDKMPDSYYESDSWGTLLERSGMWDDPVSMFNIKWCMFNGDYFGREEEGLEQILDHFLQLDLFVFGDYISAIPTRDDLIMCWIDYVLRFELETKQNITVRNS